MLALLALLWVAPAGAADDGARLPISRVVMFTSGVGFYEHQGKVQGNAAIEMKFNVDDVNDLLKSMVLEDLDGGKISTVNYGSKDPITKTLRTFAIDLTANPTLADLLNQVRGEKVQLDTPNPVTGVILGVEKKSQQVKDEVVQVVTLNLLTDDGLRSVNLDAVQKIKLLNAELDAELRKALMVLALGHATDKKSVQLNFRGEGERSVRVGYIQESPIWKTSYRLVLSDEPDKKPLMQGWAIVENTTEEDWKDVELTLISGRPISFVMNLYDPLYVTRPVVEPELFASLRPQKYGQSLEESEQAFRRAGQAGDEKGKAAESLGGARKADRAALAKGSGRNAAPAAPGAQLMEKGAALRANLQQSVQPAATGGDVGELFQYVIDTPVTLPRQQSAMLPIVNGGVEGEKVAIYDPNVHAKHPLGGLRLKNTTGLHLMQGPITVFDGGAYAGDAQIADLPPNESRLISYALDLDTEVAPEGRPVGQTLVSVRVAKGTLHTTHKQARSQHYTIKHSGKKPRKVLIEYAKDPSWKLVAPEKAEETTRDKYRFAVVADPGKPAVFDVKEEMDLFQQFSLTNLDENTIKIYLSAPVVSDKIKQALNKLVEKRRELNLVSAKRQGLEGNITAIDQEQKRIRENMAQLDRGSDLYNRYVKKLNSQEDDVEKLRKEIAAQTELEAKLRKELDEFLLGLDLQ